MLSQLYIGLPFALLNVLAFHNAPEYSSVSYNPILPLSIDVYKRQGVGLYSTRMWAINSVSYTHLSLDFFVNQFGCLFAVWAVERIFIVVVIA